MQLFALPLLRRILLPAVSLLVFAAAALPLRAADEAKKNFSVPAGRAVQTLKQFAQQSAREIVFSPEVIGETKTNAVEGEFTPRAALDRMLADTGLVAAQEQKSGAFAVRKGESPNGPGAALSAPSDRPQVSAKPADETVRLNDFVISGNLLSLRRAIAEKRGADVIADGVSADDIGSIPDFGLGEAMQRIPGVAMLINNGRGEAQFLTVRGLNADYNEVLIDGVALPSTETTRRQVSLDVVPSALADRISAYKSLSAEMDANAIGSLVNLRTRSAFEHPGLFASGRGNLGFYENKRLTHRRTPSGQAELTVTDTFGRRSQWGVVYSTSYFRRDSSSLDTAMDNENYYTSTGVKLGLTDPAIYTGGLAVPDRRRWLTYDNVRERRGNFLKLEYAGVNSLRVHLTGGYFHHINDEERQSNILAQSVNPVIATPTTGTVASGNAQADRSAFLQDRVIAYGEFGFKLSPRSGDTLEFATNWAFGHYHQDNHTDTYRIAATSQLAYAYENPYGGILYVAPVNSSYYYNAANYRQFEHTFASDDNREHILTLNLDYGHNTDADSHGFGWKAGAKLRRLTRTYDFWENQWLPVAGTNFLLSGALDPRVIVPFNGRGQYVILIDPVKAQSVFAANPAGYALNANFTARNLGSDYSLTEQIGAAYTMATYRQASFIGNAGIRFERTDFDTTSYTASTVKAATGYSLETQKNNYGKILPSAYAAYDLTSRLKVRAAVSRSLSRPNYDLIAARQTVTDNGAGAVSISTGNPALKPRESSNYDFSLEWYLSRDAIISAAVFRKDIRNEIVRTAATATSVSGGVTTLTTTTQPRNLDAVGIDGIELGFTAAHFNFLPKPFSGLGAQANVTLLDMRPGTIMMGDGTVRRLPTLNESAKSTLNASLLYDLGAFSAQLSYNRTSPMLITIATTSAVEDRYYDTRTTYDLQLRYKLSRQWSLVVQGKNLTNDRPTRVTGPNRVLIREQLDNGRAWFAGATYLFK